MNNVIDFNMAKQKQRKERLAYLHELEDKVEALDIIAAFKYNIGLPGGDPKNSSLLSDLAAAFRNNPEMFR